MAREPAVLRRAREFRAQLVAAEAASSSEMAAVYRALATRLQPRLDVVIAQLVADSASGKLASPLAAARRADVNRVLDLAESELQKYVGFSVEHVAARQSALVVKAGSHAADLARLAAGRPTLTWAQPHPEHLEKLILLLRPGTPAHAVLETLAPNGVDRVKAALVSGLAFGQTPEKIGREVQDVLGGNLGRFLTVARTEDMRAYRIATHENFRANQDVVGQWRWMAALTYSTCAACLSLHGELFPLTQEMDSHPNCRCVPVPVVGGAPTEKWQSGEQWLRSQPEEVQRKTLGPAKFEAWKKGEISLANLRGHSHNEVWGNSFHETSLKNALEKAKGSSDTTPPAWKPTMTRAEAEVWAKGSAFLEPLIHVTQSKNVESLKKEGFDLSKREVARVWGDGVYMTWDIEVTEFYEQIVPNPKRVNLVVNIQKPFIADVERDSDWTQITRQLPGGTKRYEEIFDKLNSEGMHWTDAQKEALRLHFEENGYDALIIRNPSFDAGTGGNQICVFDPKKVVILHE